MTRRSETIDPTWFDDLYRTEPDPWGFRTSDYEHGKYADTLATLPRPRYGRALEVGCSIGVFTRQLSERCDTVLGVDASAVALASARDTCRDLPGVTLECAAVPGGFPAGRFDLIVFSEVLYYLVRPDIERTAALSCAALEPGGHMILCHWLGETDYPLTGDAAADCFIASCGAAVPHLGTIRRDKYRLDLLGQP